MRPRFWGWPDRGPFRQLPGRAQRWFLRRGRWPGAQRRVLRRVLLALLPAAGRFGPPGSGQRYRPPGQGRRQGPGSPRRRHRADWDAGCPSPPLIRAAGEGACRRSGRRLWPRAVWATLTGPPCAVCDLGACRNAVLAARPRVTPRPPRGCGRGPEGSCAHCTGQAGPELCEAAFPEPTGDSARLGKGAKVRRGHKIWPGTRG